MRHLLALLLSVSTVLPARAAQLEGPIEPVSAASTPLAPVVPGALAAPSLAPIASALPVASAALISQSAPPAQAAQAAEAPKARTVLSAVAGAKEAAPAQAAAYDGMKLPSAASAPEVSAPDLSSPGKKQSFLGRLNRATDSRSRGERWFERAVPLGIAAGIAAPILWKAWSPGSILYAAPLALTAMLALFGSLSMFRALHFLAVRRDPLKTEHKGARLKGSIAGLLLGVALATAPHHFQPQLVEFGAEKFAPSFHVQAVKGDALQKAVVDELSKNPEGRDVLDGLRDRGGVIRMPRFYLADSKDAIASYNQVMDAVFITPTEVGSKQDEIGRFLNDPAAQRAFAKEHATTFAHELRHNTQARRTLKSMWDFNDSPESEYEAYVTEARFTHEALKADPHAELGSGALGGYYMALDGFDSYIKAMTSSYKDPHDGSAYYRDWIAKQRAAWPAFQVDGNVLLAERSMPTHPKIAAKYRETAAKIAAANHLPLPGPAL